MGTSTHRVVPGRRRVWLSAGLTAAAGVVLTAGLGTVVRTQGRLVLAPGPASFDEVVGTAAAVAALLLGCWWALGATAAVLAHAPGRVGTTCARVADAWSPVLTRRVAAVLVGAAVSSSVAPATALAHDAPAAPAFPGFSATAPVNATAPVSARAPEAGWQPSAPPAPEVGWTPTRPTQRPVTTPRLLASGTVTGSSHEVVVHRGDTLWDLVASHLGPDATDAEIALAWPAWHEANRAVIGDDPDRLLPGQVLHVPATAGTR